MLIGGPSQPPAGADLVATAPRASGLMLYILSPAGQVTLGQHGFTPVALLAP